MHAALPLNWLFGAAHVQLIVSHALSVSVPKPCDAPDQVVLIIITLLFGTQQSALGRDHHV